LSQQRGSTWTAAGRKKGAGHREKDKEFIDTESFRREEGGKTEGRKGEDRGTLRRSVAAR